MAENTSTKEKIETVQRYIKKKTGKSVRINLHKGAPTNLVGYTMHLLKQMKMLDKAYSIAKQHYGE